MAGGAGEPLLPPAHVIAGYTNKAVPTLANRGKGEELEKHGGGDRAA